MTQTNRKQLNYQLAEIDRMASLGINLKAMESILDHNVTEEEMNKYFGILKTKEGVERYKAGLHEVKALTHLAILYNMRGDIERKEHYLAKLRKISKSCELSARLLLLIGGF